MTVAAGYRICTRCVMDTSDPQIAFNENGVCSHCIDYERMVTQHVFSGEAARIRLERLVEDVRREGIGKDYDCIIGMSGGVDSTYVAYRVKQLGLRPIAVHLDNGWNSELAVQNIESTLRKLGIDLYTHVLDWEEFRDLQLAFLRASTPDSEIPTDHAIVALLHQMADRFGVRYILSGCNVRTETHLPGSWSQGHRDWRYIRSVHRRFGSVSLRAYPHLDYWASRRAFFSHEWIDILNLMSYVKKDAMQVLQEKLGWRYYGGKHYESIYTRFYQGYILPQKFGYDKRRAHLSSLICSGEVTRSAALQELEQEVYPETMQVEDRRYVIKKLGLTETDFEAIMHLPTKTFWDYPSYERVARSWPYRMARRLYGVVRGDRQRPMVGIAAPAASDTRAPASAGE